MADNSELDRANRMIQELRIQNASQLAAAARKNDFEKKGRLLQTVRVPSGALDVHYSIGEVFTQYAGASTELVISDPYIVSRWQI
eukprot:8679832-Karenia_brevis.AAC.1